MDDARNLQYGIGFDTADAETSVENLGEKVETLEENIGAVEVGAQQMGASAVSACQMGQGAAERFTGAVGDASGGLDDMASSASEAGNAAQKAAGHWNMTAEGLEWVEEAAQAAEAAAESFRDEMDDSGGAAGRFRAQIDLSAGFDVEVTGFDQHEVDALVASFAESGHEYELPGSEPYINNFFDSGVQAKPKSEEPAAAPAPEVPAQDAGVQPSVAPASDEVQTAQPGGKKTVIVPNLSEQDATTLVDVLKDMGFAYRLEDAA